MDTITKGRLGYNLTEKAFLERGGELFVPLLENGKVDLIACKENRFLRFQIKIISYEKDGSKKLYVKKVSHNQGQYKIHLYDENEIDYFIGADIKTDDIYIIPIDFIKQYKSSISLSTLQPYKNNFNSLNTDVV